MLPPIGLISFFAEHDYLRCCTAGLETECCAVFYWRDIDRLAPANEPIEDFEQLRNCALAFYKTQSLPDPRSDQIEVGPFDKDQRERYTNLHRAVRGHGVADPTFDEFEAIKLLGWPDLIQGGDLVARRKRGKRLLLQLGSYDDGTDLHSWGPGGAVYFSIPEEDLRERRFNRVELEVQIT